MISALSKPWPGTGVASDHDAKAAQTAHDCLKAVYGKAFACVLLEQPLGEIIVGQHPLGVVGFVSEKSGMSRATGSAIAYAGLASRGVTKPITAYVGLPVDDKNQKCTYYN